jgi:tetratricopeptide (TPR) repeat protein
MSENTNGPGRLAMPSPRLTGAAGRTSSFPQHEQPHGPNESKSRESVDIFRAFHTAQIASDPRDFARAVADLPAFLWPSPGAPNGRAIVLGEQALLPLEEHDTDLRILLSARIAAELSYHPQAKQRQGELSAVVGRFTDVSCDPEILLKILCLRDCVLRDPQLTDERLSNASRVTNLSLQTGSYQALYIGKMARVASLAELGEFQHADFEAEEAASAATLSGNRRYECGMFAYRAARAAMEGKFSDATELFEQCLAIADAIDAAELIDACWPGMILPFREMGRLAELQRRARAAVERHAYEPVYRAMLAWLLIEQGEPHEAELHLSKLLADDFALVDAAQDRLACMVALAEVCSELKNTEVASELYDRLIPYADRTATFGSCGFFGAVARYIGKLAAAASRFDEGIRHFEDAIRLNDRIAARLWSVYSRFDLACLLTRRGGQRDTVRALRLTSTLYPDVANIGMTALAIKLKSLQTDLIAYISKLAPSQTIQTAPTPSSDASLSDDRGAQHSQALPSRIFQREGDYWTLAYDGSNVRVRDIKGLTLICRLLDRPGQRLHAVELEGVTLNASGTRYSSIDPDSGPMLDSKAKSSYRTRLSELQKELAEVCNHSDGDRALELKQEASSLAQELARAVGLGGRDRNMGSEVERARLRVTNAIRFAISRVSRLHPVLGRHLKTTVITGNFCLYVAEPSSSHWRT